MHNPAPPLPCPALPAPPARRQGPPPTRHATPPHTAEADLADHIPVVKTSIAGTRLVGRLTVGNKNGLLLPNTTSDQEMQHIRNALPDEVRPAGGGRARAWGRLLRC